MIMNNLIVQLLVQILPSHQDADDPEQAGEQEVEGAEQEVEPPDRRHSTIVTSS